MVRVHTRLLHCLSVCFLILLIALATKDKVRACDDRNCSHGFEAGDKRCEVLQKQIEVNDGTSKTNADELLQVIRHRLCYRCAEGVGRKLLLSHFHQKIVHISIPHA